MRYRSDTEYVEQYGEAIALLGVPIHEGKFLPNLDETGYHGFAIDVPTAKGLARYGLRWLMSEHSPTPGTAAVHFLRWWDDIKRHHGL